MQTPFFNQKQLDDETDKLITREILKFKGNMIGSDPQNELYAKTIEVNGYVFLKLTIIGALNVRLDKGCKILVSSYFNEHPIASDDEDIKTDFSLRLNKGITRFDVLMDENDLNFIREEHPIKLTILINTRQGFWGLKTRETPYSFLLNDPAGFQALFNRDGESEDKIFTL